MTEHFDVNRIIGITVRDKSESSWKWLPRKRKKILGIFNSNSWYTWGFYPNGCYQECYESGCWDANPSSQEDLEKSGYLVDSEKIVWNKPYATVYLEHDCRVTRKFNTMEEVNRWVKKLKMMSGKNFEIVRHE